MRRIPRRTLLLLLLLAPAAHAVPVEQVPVGPRALAMGGAFTSVADDGTASFWNPAGLARIGHQELMATNADLFRTGIRDNFASFVLPISAGHAVALDWYHSGFDDTELGFRENRLDLAWGFQAHRMLWAGVAGKLLTRGTDLDGVRLRQERGMGIDVGLLVAPTDRARIGFVAQDLTGTRVRDPDGFADVAYPRNLRLGASWSWPRTATVAFDVDDRWHVGAEATPIEALALRLGVEDDRHGSEPATWSCGVGLRLAGLRVDWARVQPPTLEATDHFAVSAEFNFNPAQVRLEKLQIRDLYTSLYKSYAREAIGSVQVRNLRDRPLTARVSVFVPELMEASSEQDVILRPRAVQEVPLTAVMDERALEQRGDRPVAVQVSAAYASQRLARRERTNGRALAYAPGAIDWSAGVAQAAAFVTPRDPAVDALAREAARPVALDERNAFGNRNLAFAAAVLDALAAIGTAYVPDPQNPFQAIAEVAHAVDTIHYPSQTLERGSGDCDDTTVLVASLLGNLGVATRFVDAPGHIFLIADTGLHERHRSALGVDTSLTVVEDERVWIPIETTALGRGFVEAWRTGAEEMRSWSARGEIATIDVAEAQSRYEPAQPPGTRTPPRLDGTRFAGLLAEDERALALMREEYRAARFSGMPDPGGRSAGALAEIAALDFLGGDFAGARAGLEEALLIDPRRADLRNNLGVVLACLDSLATADEEIRAALALGLADPRGWLNLGVVRCARGDSTAAADPLARGVAAAGGHEAACGLVSLALREPEGSPAGEPAWVSGLRRAMRRAAAASPPGGPVHLAGPAPVGSRPTSTPARGIELYDHLKWIE